MLKDGERLRGRAVKVLSAVGLVPMTGDLLDDAALLSNVVRGLDAIHPAAARHVRADLHAFVAWDKRLLAAADEAGLPAVAPGRDK